MPTKIKYRFKVEQRSDGWVVLYYEDDWLIPGEEGPFDDDATAQITGELWYEAMTGRAYPRKREKPEPDERQLGFTWDDEETQ